MLRYFRGRTILHINNGLKQYVSLVEEGQMTCDPRCHSVNIFCFCSTLFVLKSSHASKWKNVLTPIDCYTDCDTEPHCTISHQHLTTVVLSDEKWEFEMQIHSSPTYDDCVFEVEGKDQAHHLNGPIRCVVEELVLPLDLCHRIQPPDGKGVSSPIVLCLLFTLSTDSG